MATITVSETINAPIEHVFAIASDLPNCEQWVKGINAIEVLEPAPDSSDNLGQVGKGFKWRETRTMFGKQATEDMWITEWSPPTGYTVEARSHGSHYLTPFTFTDLGNGSTEMKMAFTATPETFGAKIMMKVFAMMTKKLTQCLTDDMADIKRHAESGAS